MGPEGISFFTSPARYCYCKSNVRWTLWFNFSEVQVMKVVIDPKAKTQINVIKFNNPIILSVLQVIDVSYLETYFEGTRDTITKRRWAVNTRILFSVLSPPFSNFTGTFRSILACFPRMSRILSWISRVMLRRDILIVFIVALIIFSHKCSSY